MRISKILMPALILASGLHALAAVEGEPAAPAPPAPQAAAADAPPALLRAQYQWGYAGAQGQGKGTFSVLLEPGKGRVVMELQGLGERLMLLEGETAGGYRIQIPRQNLDTTAASLGTVPLPFFPQVGSVDALYQLLAKGEGPGVKVTKRDPKGPVKLRYQGVDDKGKEVMVWLERTRWEPQAAASS
jgi:hypothetical protein